jgi:hypothetical protein
MKLIETKTLGTAAASIEFTSIPQTFTDLVLTISARTVQTNSPFAVAFILLDINGGATTISWRNLFGDGSTTGSQSGTDSQVGWLPAGDATANTFGNASLYLPNYTSSTNKSLSNDAVTENNATVARQSINAGLWANTAAITSLLVKASGARDLAIGSTISLYGITKGSDGIVVVS